MRVFFFYIFLLYIVPRSTRVYSDPQGVYKRKRGLSKEGVTACRRTSFTATQRRLRRNFAGLILCILGTAVAQWLRRCATNRFDSRWRHRNFSLT